MEKFYNLYKKIALFIIPYSLFLISNVALAQGLVPACTGIECTLCDLLQLVKNVIYWMLNISIVLAGLFFAWGAILMLTARESQEQVTSGRKTMATAAMGILIAFTAWLILGTLIQVITGSPSKLPWNQIQCAIEKTAANLPPSSALNASEQEIRNQLSQSGITVNKNACPTGATYQSVAGGCTSLEGINASAIENAIQLKKNCDCPLEITGGTELGHEAGPTSHAGGYKLDFRPNPSLDQYIQKNFTPIATRSDDAKQYRAPDGTIMAREKDHWDVTFPKPK